jgi:hypothetical protein
MSILKCNRIENTSTASGGLDVDTSGKVRVTTLADSAGNNDSTPAEIASGRVKAWVNFDATGTVTIASSFNVSSITDGGQGRYQVNFTTALGNANYVVSGTVGMDGNGNESIVCLNDTSSNGMTPTTSAFRFTVVQASTLDYKDKDITAVMVIGD